MLIGFLLSFWSKTMNLNEWVAVLIYSDFSDSIQTAADCQKTNKEQELKPYYPIPFFHSLSRQTELLAPTFTSAASLTSALSKPLRRIWQLISGSN